MDRRKRTGIIEENIENPFTLSIGDLMAALLLIFVLLLASTLLKVKEIEEVVMENAQLADKYIQQKEIIYKDLKNEFEKEKKDLKIEIIKETLTIRFSDHIFFDSGKSKLKKDFDGKKTEMDDFFKRYISLLKKHKKNIKEIRIEGHTDTDPGKEEKSVCSYHEKDPYLYNMKLSQDRAQSVLKYIFESQEINKKDLNEINELIVAIGFSYSKLLPPKPDGSEDKDGSRRVEFSIRTKAEEKIEEIYKKGINDDQSRGNPQD